jgi:hypothetical protein
VSFNQNFSPVNKQQQNIFEAEKKRNLFVQRFLLHAWTLNLAKGKFC